jgi:guanylate kinase
MLIVISAPSGCGKSTIVRAILERVDGLGYSVSATSRPRRSGEVEGKSYYFLSRQEFEQRIRSAAFLEYAEVHGNLYGTLRSEVEKNLARGLDVVMDVDVQGGLQLRRTVSDTLLIFLAPPSMEVLEKRLRGRASDSEDAIRLRLENAKREMRFWPQYDYVVLNESLEEAIHNVENVIRVERLRTSRLSVEEA